MSRWSKAARSFRLREYSRPIYRPIANRACRRAACARRSFWRDRDWDREKCRDGRRRRGASGCANTAGRYIGPSRTGLVVEPLALVAAFGGIGIGIEKNVAMVEGGEELQVARIQQADISAHREPGLS